MKKLTRRQKVSLLKGTLKQLPIAVRNMDGICESLHYTIRCGRSKQLKHRLGDFNSLLLELGLQDPKPSMVTRWPGANYFWFPLGNLPERVKLVRAALRKLERA